MKNKAYTFIEVMATMIVLGILFVITAMNISKLSIDSNMSRFKNGYASIENTVNFLLNDSIYGTRIGFKDLKQAQIFLIDTNGNAVNTGEVIEEGVSKFRNSFKHYLNVTKDNIDCEIYKFPLKDSCFMTDDGVVFGIPDTNFRDKGTVPVKVDDGNPLNLVPVTMYVNFDGKSKDPACDAFIVGIQYDGNIRFIKDSKNCCQENKRAMQCRLNDYVKSTTVSSISEE